MTFTITLLAMTIGQAHAVDRKYDKFRDFTTAKVEVGPVGKDGDNIVLMLYNFSRGEQVRPVSATDRVDLTFLSASESWKFLRLNDMHILAGGNRYSAKRGDHEGNINVNRSGVGVTEMVSSTVAFSDFEKIASSEKVEIAVGTAEFNLSPEQILIFRRFVAELKLDRAALESLVKEEDRLARLKAADEERRSKLLAEEQRAARERWMARVALVYPVAKKALTEARNRGGQASSSNRKAVTKKELDKAATTLCRDYDITREELEQVMVDGKVLDEKPKAVDPAIKAAASLENAEAIEKAGRSEDALKIYQAIVRDYPDTPAGAKAKTAMDVLMGKPKKKK